MKIVIQKGILGSDFYSFHTDAWENAVKLKKEGQDFIWIHHSESQDVSRWKSKPRTRPFLVEIVTTKNIAWHRLGAYKTLNAALLSATKYVGNRGGL